jgi:hypothetical protein
MDVGCVQETIDAVTCNILAESLISDHIGKIENCIFGIKKILIVNFRLDD